RGGCGRPPSAGFRPARPGSTDPRAGRPTPGSTDPRAGRPYAGQVPSYPTRLPTLPVWTDDTVAADGTVERLAGLVGSGGVVVLSGAGLSTESGIPDY